MIAVAAGAFLLDCLLGDPKGKWHPVVGIGRIITFFENRLYRAQDTDEAKLIKGGWLTAGTLCAAAAAAAVLLWLSTLVGWYWYLCMQIVLLYCTIAPRSLAEAGLELYHLLQKNDILEARRKVGWIVGRDTQDLDEGEITRATIETVAENIVDGIISPLFYYFVFGVMGAVLYRAANTMDSMVGYKNERYLFFGRIAAKLDDALNYIPARLTFLLLVCAAFLVRRDWKNALRIGLRDASRHPSPNGGYAEAPTAGALHIRLGGMNYYGGQPNFRAYMGDPDNALSRKYIIQTIQLMYVSTVLGIVIFSLCWSIL